MGLTLEEISRVEGEVAWRFPPRFWPKLQITDEHRAIVADLRVSNNSGQEHLMPVQVFIDADACPVKEETYRVARRHGLRVIVVANQWMGMPDDPEIRLEVVDDAFDAADNWIVERAAAGDVVITDDIPLAARCLAKGACVLTNRGEERNEDSIGEALAMRQLMQYLRDAGDAGGGQGPLQSRDRSHFMQQLDRMLVSAKRRH